MSDTYVALWGIVGAFAASILGSWLVFRTQMKRIPSQNVKDDMDAAKNALEIAEMSSARQLALEREVQDLRRLVGNPRHFKVTVVFTAAEIPRMEKAEVEEINELRNLQIVTTE